MTAAMQGVPRWRRLNWWKIGFFVVLAAFELAREVAVIGANSPPRLLTHASVFTWGGSTIAEGSWQRIDGGSALSPAAIRIECDQERGECIEVSVGTYADAIFAPDMDRHEAQFTPDAVTFQNTYPKCAKYTVRIDLRLKKVLGVRERTADKSDMCNKLEQRIEMQLGNGVDYSVDPLKGHFVPLLSLIRATMKLF